MSQAGRQLASGVRGLNGGRKRLKVVGWKNKGNQAEQNLHPWAFSMCNQHLLPALVKDVFKWPGPTD